MTTASKGLKAHEIKLRYLGTDYYLITIADNAEEAVRKSKAALQEKTGMAVEFELLELSQRMAQVVL